MDNNRTIRLTGLYGQMITVRAREILRVMPHVCWTEIVIIGCTTIKVLEGGEYVQAMLGRSEGKEND